MTSQADHQSTGGSKDLIPLSTMVLQEQATPYGTPGYREASGTQDLGESATGKNSRDRVRDLLVLCFAAVFLYAASPSIQVSPTTASYRCVLAQAMDPAKNENKHASK